MRKFTRFFLRMTLFLAIIITGTAFILPEIQSFFEANIPINGTIIGLFTVGVIFLYFQVWQLRKEVVWIENFQQDRHLIESTPLPKLLAPMASLLKDSSASLNTYLVRSILDSVQGRLSENREISRYIIGSLVFLGLVGTFWGLLQTVSSISLVIKELDITSTDFTVLFEKLKYGLEAPMSGMSIAFSSSLFGLTGSLILGFIELQASQAQNQFYTDLEDWLSDRTKIYTEPSLDHSAQAPLPHYVMALLEKVTEQLQQFQFVIENLEDKNRNIAQEVHLLNNSLLALSENMKSEQRLLHRLTESHTEITPILTDFVKKLSGEKDNNREDLKNHQKIIEITLLKILEEMKSSRQQFSKDFHQEIKLFLRSIDKSDAQS